MQEASSRVGSVLGDLHLCARNLESTPHPEHRSPSLRSHSGRTLDALPERRTVTLVGTLGVSSRPGVQLERKRRTTPYFPVTPTFFVRLVILSTRKRGGRGRGAVGRGHRQFSTGRRTEVGRAGGTARRGEHQYGAFGQHASSGTHLVSWSGGLEELASNRRVGCAVDGRSQTFQWSRETEVSREFSH